MSRASDGEKTVGQAADAFTVGLLRSLEGRAPRRQVEMLAVVIGHLHAAQKAQAAATDRLLSLLEQS